MAEAPGREKHIGVESVSTDIEKVKHTKELVRQSRDLITALTTDLVEKEEELEETRPKAEFYDHVTESDHVMSMGEAAKVLNFRNIGGVNLFEKLRAERILGWSSRDWNVPYQRYIDRGWFRVVERTYRLPGGEQKISTKTVVTQKGLAGIRRKLIEIGAEPNSE